MFRKIMIGAITVLVLSSVSSCALWRDRHDPEPAAAPIAEEASATTADWEAQVANLLKRHIESAAHSREADQQRVIRRKPYYFKEYAVYPEESRDISVELTETESRSKPCIANATVAKVRYATRLHRSRTEAERDDNFMRDTGAETVTFELRNGRWTRVGSLFEAETSEEKIGNEWQPRKEENTLSVPQEEEKGWFGSMWSKIRGGE